MGEFHFHLGLQGHIYTEEKEGTTPLLSSALFFAMDHLHGSRAQGRNADLHNTPFGG
jgi:hypothetical protein